MLLNRGRIKIDKNIIFPKILAKTNLLELINRKIFSDISKRFERCLQSTYSFRKIKYY